MTYYYTASIQYTVYSTVYSSTVYYCGAAVLKIKVLGAINYKVSKFEGVRGIKYFATVHLRLNLLVLQSIHPCFIYREL
jgi:hypothetical protein